MGFVAALAAVSRGWSRGVVPGSCIAAPSAVPVSVCERLWGRARCVSAATEGVSIWGRHRIGYAAL